MVMLMIKFGAYKAACCWVCAPSFRADNKTYEETIWASEKIKRKIRFQNHFWLSSLLLFFFPQFFPSLSPSPEEGSFFSVYYGEEEGEREMPVPPKTPRSPMTPNSQAMTNNVLLDGSLSERRKSKIPIELWVRGIALLGVLLIAVLLVMHGSRNLSLKDDVIPKISNPVNFFIFNAVVTSFAVIPGAASATCVAAGVIFGAGFGTILIVLSAGTGGVISFFIARYAARPLIEKLFITEGGRFQILDQAVVRDSRQIVLLLRLSPFSPYTVMSYLLGLTAVPFWPYCWCTYAGIVPASFVYVYLGVTGRKAANGSKASHVELLFYVFGLVVTVLVTQRIVAIYNEVLGAKVGGVDIGPQCFSTARPGGIPEEGEEIEMAEKSIGDEFASELDRMKEMENGEMSNGDVLLAPLSPTRKGSAPVAVILGRGDSTSLRSSGFHPKGGDARARKNVE